MVLGTLGFGWALGALAYVSCRTQSCIQTVAGPGTFAIIVAMGMGQLLYLRWWRARKRQAVAVTLLAYALAVIATTVIIIT